MSVKSRAPAAVIASPALREAIRFHDLARALRMHRLRSRLHDEELPGAPVLRPLDVHRRGAPALG